MDQNNQAAAPDSISKPGSNSGAGLDQNTAGALAYLLFFFTGIYFLVTEKTNKFIRFHAFQSIMFGIAAVIASAIASIIPTALGALVQWVVDVGIFVLWVYLMYQAYSGKQYKLPYIGDMAEQQLGK